MTQIGTVTGQEIKTNRDGGVQVRLLQVRMSSDTDIQTVQYFPMSGDDSPPQKGDKIAVVNIGPAFQIALGIQDSVIPSMPAGEKKLYSRDSSGNIAAFINFLTNGTLELNGNNDFAVRFTALETALQSLITQVNATFATKLNGSGTAGAVAVDFTPAKVVEVKVI